MQMKEIGASYEYRIVSHGCDDSTYLAPYIERLGEGGRSVHWQHFTEPLGAQTARQRASAGAKGDILYFTEDHVLTGRDYFKRAVANFNSGVDALHSSLKLSMGDSKRYHYKLDGLQNNFIGSGESRSPLDPFKTHRIAVGNHGSWFCRRSVFESVGGYGPDDLLAGYAGDEHYFDLKLALLDKTNSVDPIMVHYHYTKNVGGEPKGYPEHFGDDYYRNLMTCAFVIGGPKWVDGVFENFKKEQPNGQQRMTKLYEEAYARGTEHAAYLASIRKRTLEQQLEKWKTDGGVAF